MALYQPSFCVPRNQSIDATDEQNMTFSFKLNGNNPLVAYNIQIFDNDTNELVYELVSTENERKIQAKIAEIAGWINYQHAKEELLSENQEEFNNSNLKNAFKIYLRNKVSSEKTKIIAMQKTLDDKNAGRSISQQDITKFFQYWEDTITSLGDAIGEENTSITTTGEYILNTIENWLDIDPARKDGIEYLNKTNIINRTNFNKVKEIYEDLKQYYQNTMQARQSAGASDTTYITSTAVSKARQAVYLKLSEFTNESYFGKDLYEAVNKVWGDADFSVLMSEIYRYEDLWKAEITQQEYALAHLNGGQTKQTTKVYNSPSASDSNIAFIMPQGSEVAIITAPTTPPSGWAYISSGGNFGYIQTQYIQEYNIQEGKYYLEHPVYPYNYEGEQNTVYHQLPINVLENGKDYKWAVTLYWSTSGKYNEDDKIDGKLTSVENYFNTRKIPVVELANYKEIFTIPFNYVTLVTSVQVEATEEDGTIIKKTIDAGSSVRIITLVENNPSQVKIEYTDTQTNKTYYATTAVSALSDLGLYGTSDNYILPSKKATFVGGYEQQQYSSIAYFRWVLRKLQYDTEEVVEVVKDTGLIPSAEFKFYYDGFINDEKYDIQIFVQTIDNVEVQTDPIKFKASYISFEIDNMINAENSPIEHGIIVEWSNLRLINGEVEGDNTSTNYKQTGYQTDLPTEGKISYTLKEGADIVWDRDKGQPMEIDWDATQIISTRFDEERPTEPKVMYIASGLDDNGDVISKTLTVIPTETTQTDGKVILRYTIKTEKTEDNFDVEIIASKDYWYIIIMKTDGFSVYRKYAQGLFPALDQYPNLNKFTGQRVLVPDGLTYLEEESDRVEYNYQTIVDREGNPIENNEG